MSVLVIFMDPAFVGLAFVGAFVLMEKGAGTLSALKVTPLSASIYLASKLTTFTVLGVVCGLPIAWATAGNTFNLPLMLLGLVLSNATAVLMGFASVVRTRSVNAFLANLLVVSVVLCLPLLSFFNIVPSVVADALKLIPSYAMLKVIEAGMDPVTSITVPVIYLAAWVTGGWLWCLREYDHHLVVQGQ